MIRAAQNGGSALHSIELAFDRDRIADEQQIKQSAAFP
jgi:hypothetical protein